MGGEGRAEGQINSVQAKAPPAGVKMPVRADVHRPELAGGFGSQPLRSVIPGEASSQGNTNGNSGAGSAAATAVTRHNPKSVMKVRLLTALTSLSD